MNFLSVFQSIQESNGASYNLHTRELNPSTGYMVAIPGFEQIYDVPANFDQFQDVAVKYAVNLGVYIKTNENPDKIFLGFWVHEDKLYIDLAENVEDLGTAYHLAFFGNQLAIYDCKNKCDIKTLTVNGAWFTNTDPIEDIKIWK